MLINFRRNLFRKIMTSVTYVEGAFSGMQFVNSVIGLVFVYFVLVPIQEKWSVGACLIAIVLSILSLRIWTYTAIVSLFAVISSGLMFFFLGYFLNSAPGLDFSGISEKHASHLIAAFLLIPIISEFTNQSKADDETNRLRRENRSIRKAKLKGLLRQGGKNI